MTALEDQLTSELTASFGELVMMATATNDFKRGFLGGVMRVAIAAGIDTKPFIARAVTLGITTDRKKIAEAKALKGRKDKAWHDYTFCMELYGPDRHETKATREDYCAIECEGQTFQAFNPLEWAVA